MEYAGTLWGRPNDVLAGLLGGWTLDRTVDTGASMHGIARFEPAAEGWIDYREEGELQLAGGERFGASRHYRYRALAAGFAIFFRETPARLFQAVILERLPAGWLAGRASHLCAQDLYRSEYLFAPEGGFSVRHQVRGPHKDFTISTIYRRVLGRGGVS